MTTDRLDLEVPLVSVLMPVYNGEAFIDRSVDSILKQTFTDFEVVIVDDGSTDSTAQRLRDLAARDTRVRIVTHTENRGLVASLNYGLTMCRGELVARLDADDEALPSRLEHQVAIFRSGPQIVLSASSYERVTDSGEFTRLGVPPQTHAALAIAMLVGNRIQHSTTMFRRDAVVSVGGYDVRWFPVEDYDLWLRLLEVGEYRGLPSVEVRYTLNPDGVSATRHADQEALSIERASVYLQHLLSCDCPTTIASPPSLRAVSRATSVLHSQLRWRDIPADGLYQQARLTMNAILKVDVPILRRLKILISSPRIAVMGRSHARRRIGRR